MNNVLRYLENSARIYPDKKCLDDNESSMTFGELLAFSQKIGYRIKNASYKNKAIGVIAARSIYTVPAFFGVVYSGNFYVPIDPELPSEKIKSIITDAEISTVIGTENEKSFISTVGFCGEYISIENIEEHTCDFPDTGDDDPLYMIYTSGSTGKPKGVLKSHNAVISFAETYCSHFGFDNNEIIGNQTPFYFDASAKDIYMMLKTGCTLEIIPSRLFSFSTELIEYLNLKQITFASWVPTVISIVSQLNPFSYVKPETLKRVFFVGESMPMKHLNRWRRELPDIQYVNLYGQSEIAGVCCYYEVKGAFSDFESLPIGKTFENAEVYLINDDQIVTQPGVVGELYIVSPALALCYYNDKAKTDEKFIIKDFGNGPVRCFKTGDLAEYNFDKDLVFVSRNDFQIKHMGHRIELGEIETVAGALHGIARCCCLYNTEKQKIVLFCETENNADMTAAQIKHDLKAVLTPYMLPQKVIVLDRLPLTANNKIDRQSLKSMM